MGPPHTRASPKEEQDVKLLSVYRGAVSHQSSVISGFHVAFSKVCSENSGVVFMRSPVVSGFRGARPLISHFTATSRIRTLGKRG